MARPVRKRLVFPSLGLIKSTAYSQGPEFGSAYVNNFWPTQWQSGRARGGTRLGTDSFGSLGTTPRNWSPVTWTASSVTYRGIVVAGSAGAYITTGSSFTGAISTAAADRMCTATVLNNVLYFARYGETTLYRTLTNPGSAGGTVLDATASEGYAETPGSGTGGGTPPADCGLCCVHQGRLVLAGSKADEHVLYMSRAGYPLDWDYAQTDTGAAWATSGGQSGKIGDPIVALIPHTDECTIVGCTDSMYVVNGNPTANSSLYVLSQSIGPISQGAWCKTANGWTFILTRDGLYKMPPGCPGQHPEPVSRINLPEELVAIDPNSASTFVSLAYDPRFIGIHIYVNTSGGDSHYFYDLVKEGFWPMSFGASMRMAATLPLAADTTESAIIAFSSGGTAYQFTTDSTESIASYCTYGPILLASDGTTGRINEVIASLAENSGTVSWKIYVGNSATEAYTKLAADDADFTGVDWEVQATWEKGVSGTLRPRQLQYAQNPLRSGQCCYLKIYSSGTAATRISVEEIEMTMVPCGPRRVM